MNAANVHSRHIQAGKLEKWEQRVNKGMFQTLAGAWPSLHKLVPPASLNHAMAVAGSHSSSMRLSNSKKISSRLMPGELERFWEIGFGKAHLYPIPEKQLKSDLGLLTVLLVVVPTLRFLKSCGEPPYCPAICFRTSAATVLQTEEKSKEKKKSAQSIVITTWTLRAYSQSEVTIQHFPNISPITMTRSHNMVTSAIFIYY